MSSRSAIFCLLMVSSAANLGSQARSERPLGANCSVRIAVVDAWQGRDSAFDPEILECGVAGGQALAQLLTRLSRTSDTNTFNSHVLNSLRALRDGNVVHAAVRVARDPGASQVARTAAIVVLMNQYHSAMVPPGGWTWRQLLTDTVPRDQRPGLLVGLPRVDGGAPHPPNLPELVAETMDFVADDVTAPLSLRSFAAMVRRWVLEVPVRLAPPERIDPSDVKASHRCDVFFTIRYGGTVLGATIEYFMPDSSRRGIIRLRPGRDVVVPVGIRGQPLRMFVNNEALPPIPMATTPCGN